MFEKEAEEYLKKDGTKAEQILDMLNEISPLKITLKQVPFILAMIQQVFKDGAEFGYNKANEWHRVSDKLPKMGVFVYLWRKGDDFPVVACRHIFRGHKEWVWYCMWGSGYTMSQLKGKDYLWKEIVLPEGGEW